MGEEKIEDYLAGFSGGEIEEALQEGEWSVGHFRVKRAEYYSPTGSSSDSWEGYGVYGPKNEFLFDIKGRYPDSQLSERIRRRATEIAEACREEMALLADKLTRLLGEEGGENAFG